MLIVRRTRLGQRKLKVERKYDASKYCQFNDSNVQVLPSILIEWGSVFRYKIGEQRTNKNSLYIFLESLTFNPHVLQILRTRFACCGCCKICCPYQPKTHDESFLFVDHNVYRADLVHRINKNAGDRIGCMGLWQYKLDFPHQKMVSIEIGQPTPLQNLTSYFCYS